MTTPATTTSSPRAQSLLAGLRDFVPEVMDMTGTPGLALAVGHGESILCEEAFGYADLDRRRAMTSDAVFRAGSVSKLPTVITVLQLVERGVLGLHDPVRMHMPDLPLLNPLGEREITIYDLLTFRSGLRTDTIDAHAYPPSSLSMYAEQELHAGIRREYRGRNWEGEMVSRWGAKVGASYQYSSFGIALLGLLVEQVNPEHLPFYEYVQRSVFAPLEMGSTVLPPVQTPPFVPPDILARVTPGYVRFNTRYVRSPVLHSATYPACSLLTTAGDHLRLLLALMNGGAHGGARLLAPATVDLLLKPQVVGAELVEGFTWSNGLVIELFDVGQSTFHFGEIGCYPWGWWTDSRAYPHQQFAVVTGVNKWDFPRWFNSPRGSAPGLIADYVREWFAGEDCVASASDTTREWRRAYLAGYLLAERTYGLLGVSDGCDVNALDELADSAVWDRAGFSAGVGDALGALTPDASRKFVASPGFRIPAREISAVAQSLSGRGELRVPLRFYASAR